MEKEGIEKLKGDESDSDEPRGVLGQPIDQEKDRSKNIEVHV